MGGAEKLQIGSCLEYLHKQVHLITVATTNAFVWKVERHENITKYEGKQNVIHF